MIKTNDLAELSKPVGTWPIVGCGITALTGWSLPPISGVPATGPCARGQDRIFTSYVSFAGAVAHKTVRAGSTVIFDPEKWLYTPTYEVDSQPQYEILAGQLARASDIAIIYTPQGSPGAALDAQFRAVAPYASVVEIQSQYLQGDPANFAKQVRHDIAVIRAVNAKVPILAGFASDPGGIPASVSNMVHAYQDVSSLVQGFQLNMAEWRRPYGSGCAPVGCSAIGLQFLTDIGIKS